MKSIKVRRAFSQGSSPKARNCLTAMGPRSKAQLLILASLAALILVSGCNAGTQSATQLPLSANQVATPLVPQRLDLPPTLEDSVRVNLGDAKLRVPKALFDPAQIPKDPNQALALQMLRLIAFWYPDMTLTCFGQNCIKRKSDTELDPNLQTDRRFKIFITSIVYSPDDPNMRDSRPSDIMGIASNFSGPPKLSPSAFKGLQSFSFKEGFEKRHGASKVPPLGPYGRGFIQTPDRPYELRIVCSTAQCQGAIYSPSHHLNIRMLTTQNSDAVIAQIDDFVTAINKTLNGWDE